MLGSHKHKLGVSMNFNEQLIITLIPVLLSSVVSVILVYFLNNRRDKKDYKRKKLEELHEIIEDDANKFFKFWIRYMAAFEGSITLNDARSRNVSLTDGMDRKSKAMMLSNLYFPRLRSSLENYWMQKAELTKIINEMSKQLDANAHSVLPLEKFRECQSGASKAKDALVNKIMKEARKI